MSNFGKELAGPVGHNLHSDIDQQIAEFESAMLNTFRDNGLPTEGVLVPARQRARVFNNLGDALEPLGRDRVANSLYLSKFLAAVAAGLFDAALNYLWDETVGALRSRIAAYDISYFYDSAFSSASEQRKNLRTAEDLSKITDQNLLDGARKIELLSDTGYKQLDLVRFMRNHASAAHPNQIDLRASQLIDYLEICVKEVICLPEDEAAVEIKRLLDNVKKQKFTKQDVYATGETFRRLTDDQTSNLANGLSGIYTRLDTEASIRDNIRLLLPKLWPYLTDESRRQFGVRALRFTVNQDTGQADLARELLDAVDGNAYLPQDLQIPYILEALDDLRTAHHGWDNFSNEGAPAKELLRAVGVPPNVPASIEREYVQTLVNVFLTNGNGESWTAEPIYTKLIESFTPRQADVALLQIMEETIAVKMDRKKVIRKWQDLLEMLEPKLVSKPSKIFYKALVDYAAPLSTAHKDGKLKKIAQDLTQVVS